MECPKEGTSSESQAHGVILSDSRCWGIWNMDWTGFALDDLMIVCQRGARVESFERIETRFSFSVMDRVSFKLALGVNNILDGESARVVMGKLLGLRAHLMECYPMSLVVFGDVCPVNLDLYTSISGRPSRVSTLDANLAIEELNGLIHVENKLTHDFYPRGGSAPFLAQGVNRTRKVIGPDGKAYSGPVTRWGQLPDGLHVKDECKRYWIKSFIKSFGIDRGTFASCTI